MNPRMTIGRAAAASGTHVTTIRYYERAGLLPQPARPGGSHRVYANEQVDRLLFIRRARDLGFSIAQIRTLLELAGQPRTSCREVQQLGAAHLQEIRQKIRDLMQLESMLTATIAQCSGQPSAPCAMLDWLKAATLE
jgi:MerR family mercuric resistance operon transcriptional regulator